MSMPKIPSGENRPNRDEVTIDLLESIALEEIALAHILNAEGEKMQAFVGKNFDFPTCPTNTEIIEFNQSVTELVETVLMKEWILLRKFRQVLKLIHLNDK
jgi:hypothetical protein